jgi:hypothetical protein
MRDLRRNHYRPHSGILEARVSYIHTADPEITEISKWMLEFTACTQ